jgi:hypothetical protein
MAKEGSRATVEPAWYLARGGVPVLAAKWRGKAAPDWYCHEGDEAWTRITPERLQELSMRLTKGGARE